VTGLPVSVSTHVLDMARGVPASGVPVSLELHEDGDWRAVGDAVTDADGRAALAGDLPGGRYRLSFDTAAYHGENAWTPQVIVVVELAAGSGHTHLPLLLSPFGYTTYRGS
jgi:5-hydroxyisourate hydrolase